MANLFGKLSVSILCFLVFNILPNTLALQTPPVSVQLIELRAKLAKL